MVSVKAGGNMLASVIGGYAIADGGAGIVDTINSAATSMGDCTGDLIAEIAKMVVGALITWFFQRREQKRREKKAVTVTSEQNQSN